MVVRMKHIYALAALVFFTASVTSVYGATHSFTINMEDTSQESITGNGWRECGEDCGFGCAGTIWPYNSPNWEEPGYVFDSDYAGDATCTLTLKSTGFSTAGEQIHQSQEWVEGRVNDVVFGRTPDICTDQTGCGCNIASVTTTKPVSIKKTGNVVTVKRGWNSVDIKGGTLRCTVEITCDEGYLEEYRCQGFNLQRKYQNRDCSIEWRLIEACRYGCVNNECLPGCDPGYLNDTQCNGNIVQRKYRNYDCSTEWRNYETCAYGCSDGSCKPNRDPYCTDSDGGQVWAIQGNTYGIDNSFLSFSKFDYCTGNLLNEYYCSGNNWAVTQYQCTGNCADGRCVPNGCTDECTTYNQQECSGSTGYRVCGYYDTDVCFDWKFTPCDPDETCVTGGYCRPDDDCDPGYQDDYRCNGNWRQRLYTDEDCNDEWRNYDYCENGCEDDECQNDDCDEGYKNEYQCSGNWRQRLFTNADCDDEWRNYEFCSSGCFNGQCYIQPPCPTCCGCQTCPCPPQEYCGNGRCTAGETCSSCPQDCGTCNTCGNGICSLGETCSSCPQDCGQCAYCGNGVCNPGESCSTCPNDCGTCNTCGNGVCSAGETCSTCPQDCGTCNYCGNGVCTLGETCTSCPQDCGTCNTCGNGICAGDETCSNCPNDCGSCSTCGDGSCNNGETCSNCPNDCGSCSTCGDGSCSNGETCSSCQIDCGICDLCGDGVCTGAESCLNCQSDCGTCITPCGIEIGENVEVTAEACIEFRGSGSDQFNLTLYNREAHSVVYEIDLSGDAAGWAATQSPSIRVPEFGTGVFVINVDVPANTPQGLYNLSARVRSGGEEILTKQLYVSVAEPVEPGQQPIAVIRETPTGALILGGIDLIWVLVGLAAVVNLVLLVVLIQKRRG